MTWAAGVQSDTSAHTPAALMLTGMFRLVTTMRRGTASGMPQAWPRYASVEAARTGAAELLREERVLRVMIVRNEVPGAFVEWVEK
jgi:hypothetical protein